MCAASFGSFYLAKEECLCGSSPTAVTACYLYPKHSSLPTPIPWPCESLSSTAGQQNHLATKCNWPLFCVPAEWALPALELGLCLGMRAPRCHGDQTSVMWSPDTSVRCMSAWVGVAKKAKGINNKQKNLSPLCRTQLASHRDNRAASLSLTLVPVDSFGYSSSRSICRLSYNRAGGRIKWEPTAVSHFFFPSDAARAKTANLMTF